MGQIRNEKIDVIKGLAIILVVLGHCGFPATDFIYLFHMAIFFIASGYCWNEANVKDVGGLKHYLYKKIKGLYLPYVIYNCVFELLYNLLIDLNIYTDNQAFTGKIRTKTSFLQTINEVLSIFHFDPSSCHQLCGAAWFVIVLFYTTIIVAILFYLTYHLNSVIKNVIVFIVAVAALICSYYFMQNEISLKWYFTPTFPAIFLYIVGYFIRKISALYDNKIIAVGGQFAGTTIFWGIISLLSLVWANKQGSISLGSNYYKNPLFLIVVSLMGWLLVSSCASIICKYNWGTKIFTTIGQNSIHILFLHFLSFKIINYIQVFLYHEDAYLVATFPTLHNNGIWWVAYALVGVGIPTIIGLIIKKFNVFVRTNNNMYASIK